jgi:hypothetical protein
MSKLRCARDTIIEFIHWVRWGKITEEVVDAIANVPCEIQYRDRNGTIIGYWAYGYFDPSLPYKG